VSGQRATYRAAGVDLDAADEAVGRIQPHLQRTHTAQVLDSALTGGYGGLYRLAAGGSRAKPVLVTSTDGVGTKVELARALGRLDTVGVDLVAMVGNDLVCAGAEPLVFNDHLVVGRLVPDEVERIVAGVADGCERAGCALTGGEVAEHPGSLAPGQFDLAGFGVGVVDADAMLGPARVRAGDAIVALASSGPHSNGYSLIRRATADVDLGADHGLVTQSLGEALLRPTRVYASDCLALAAATDVHALCHVTGGGVPGNLSRVLPAGCGAVVRTATAAVPEVFRVLQRLGGVDEAEMWRVFNMGMGMLAIVADAEQACAALADRGVDAWACGEVVAGQGVQLL
jgi:phosphoribosylformylglycinamidine cyclo-ligase